MQKTYTTIEVPSELDVWSVAKRNRYEGLYAGPPGNRRHVCTEGPRRPLLRWEGEYLDPGEEKLLWFTVNKWKQTISGNPILNRYELVCELRVKLYAYKHSHNGAIPTIASGPNAGKPDLNWYSQAVRWILTHKYGYRLRRNFIEQPPVVQVRDGPDISADEKLDLLRRVYTRYGVPKGRWDSPTASRDSDPNSEESLERALQGKDDYEIPPDQAASIEADAGGIRYNHTTVFVKLSPVERYKSPEDKSRRAVYRELFWTYVNRAPELTKYLNDIARIPTWRERAARWGYASPQGARYFARHELRRRLQACGNASLYLRKYVEIAAS